MSLAVGFSMGEYSFKESRCKMCLIEIQVKTRRRSGNLCAACKVEVSKGDKRVFYNNHRDKILATSKLYWSANSAKLAETHKKWWAANKEKMASHRKTT
jgi:hypothetical protein